MGHTLYVLFPLTPVSSIKESTMFGMCISSRYSGNYQSVAVSEYIARIPALSEVPDYSRGIIMEVICLRCGPIRPVNGGVNRVGRIVFPAGYPTQEWIINKRGLRKLDVTQVGDVDPHWLTRDHRNSADWPSIIIRTNRGISGSWQLRDATLYSESRGTLRRWWDLKHGKLFFKYLFWFSPKCNTGLPNSKCCACVTGAESIIQLERHA